MRSVTACMCATVLTCSIASAQTPGPPVRVGLDAAVASPPSPVGAGARATGLGSAFIAIADDATAASWNPAGLIQLERPEISAVGRLAHQVDRVGTIRTQTPSGLEGVDTFAELDVGTGRTTRADLNYASAALPFSWRGRNMVVSLNYQQVLSFDREFDYSRAESTLETVESRSIEFVQEGSLYALSPALAVELGPRLSVGATLNYWFDGLGNDYAWRRKNRLTTEGTGGEPDAITTDQFEYRNFRGVNGTFGLLWRIADRWTFGAVVDLPFEGRFTLETSAVTPDGQRIGAHFPDLGLELPLSYGFGVSFRPDDAWLLSIDATRVHWSDFRLTDNLGGETLVTGDPAGTVSVDDLTTVRAGVEYLLMLPELLLAVRGGAFYDPEPSRGSPEDLYGVSLGLGATRPDWSLDLAYQLRFGLDVSQPGAFSRLFGAPEAEFDLWQHYFYLSLVYYL